MHNFVFVAGLNCGGQPLRSGEYLQIALNGDPIGGEAQVGKETGNAETLGDVASFSIHYDSDPRVHCVTGAGDFPRGFAFSWNRNSV